EEDPVGAVTRLAVGDAADAVRDASRDLAKDGLGIGQVDAAVEVDTGGWHGVAPFTCDCAANSEVRSGAGWTSPRPPIGPGWGTASVVRATGQLPGRHRARALRPLVIGAAWRGPARLAGRAAPATAVRSRHAANVTPRWRTAALPSCR